MILTSESVTPGHPDKICDTIADRIVDCALNQDKYSKMAVEASIKDDFVLIFGEANTKATIDYVAIARQVLVELGYQNEFEVVVKVGQQSSEINRAVVRDELAAGDQGIMFGYACDENDQFLPMPIYLAHKLSKNLFALSQSYDWILTDGKTQVSVKYNQHHQVESVTNIVVSVQHKEHVSQEQLQEVILNMIHRTIEQKLITKDTQIAINPSGKFTIGGPFGDSGTTGRKIVVDSYGGIGRVGGGCFSSKDPTKVDRSGAYYARYIAKSIVANGLAKRCEVGLSYAIGQKNPLTIEVDTFNTSKYTNDEILSIIQRNFDCSVANIIEELDLFRPIYAKTTNFGHFTKNDLPWEQVKRLTID